MWMRSISIYLIALVALVAGNHISYGQSRTVITGQVIDKSTGEPIPFANVYFKSTSVGATSDFDGKYAISTYEGYDSLVASYIGYNTLTLPVKSGTIQTINFYLDPGTVNLEEIVVYSGENPAWAIIRKAVKAKNQHDKRALDSYEYESYNKIEIDIDNFSEDLKSTKAFGQVAAVMDSIAQLRGYDGDPILPVFISESVSNYYVKTDPFAKREEVLKTRIKGVGVDDGSFISQIIGASYQEYNFYRNWLNILNKEFISPISDGWRLYYDYDLIDSLEIDGEECFLLNVVPKRDEDPAFNGSIWITKKDYALKQVDLKIDKSTNLNFVEYIRIQQELVPTSEGPSIPSKTRVLVDVSPLDDDTPGLLTKFYNSARNIKVNTNRKNSFYSSEVMVKEDYAIYDEEYWDDHRHEPLKDEELYAYEMIDTLRTIPVVKRYEKIVQTLSTGYFRVGKIDIGPWPYTWAYNDFEGHRFRAGFKTNINFSNKWKFNSYIAYGTEDKQIKYGVSLGYIIDRYPWTEIGIKRIAEVDQLGLKSEDLQDNQIFLAASRFGTLIRPYWYENNKLFFKTELLKGLNQTININLEHYDPQFPFYYYDNGIPEASTLKSRFDVASVEYSIRYARDERFVQFENSRLSLGINRWPSLEVSYTYGIQGALGDLEFHKLEVDFRQRVNFGFLGITNYQIKGGKVFNTVPYPILENHIGNESFFYTSAAFNTMNFFEFVSDTYTSFRWQHQFGGLILNRIPLMRKLKWRLLATSNILYGSLSQENIDLIPAQGPDGTDLPPFKGLGDDPYVEVGYGIENILRFIRFDVFHRLSYLDEPNANKIAFKVSMQIIL